MSAGGLKEGPVSVQPKGTLNPGTIREVASADSIRDGEFGPLAGRERLGVAIECAEEGERFGKLVEVC